MIDHLLVTPPLKLQSSYIACATRLVRALAMRISGSGFRPCPVVWQLIDASPRDGTGFRQAD